MFMLWIVFVRTMQVRMEADGTVSEVKVAHTGDPEVSVNKKRCNLWSFCEYSCSTLAVVN